VVHHGDIINIKCSNPYIVVTPAQITLTKLDGTGILRKYLNIFCDEVNSFGFLEVSSTNCNGKVSRATADIHIAKPEGYRRELKEYGLVFDHENLTVKPGKARTISLVGYVPKIPDGSKIRIQVMDKSKDLEDEIDISPKTIILHHEDAEKGLCKYDVSITGYGEGNKISIHASAKDPDGDELPGVETLMEVQVSSQATGGAGSGTGAFGVPEFNDKTDPLHPIGSSKDAGTEKLIIYTEYPTTKYLLKNGRKTLEAKIKIADLICRFTFRQLAEQKVLSSGLFTDFASRFNKVEGVAEELERLHGKKIMEMMIGAIN
jgi:hypothetical protein